MNTQNDSLNHDDSMYNKSEYAKWIILGLLLPIVGIIVGIVYITKPDKRAKKMGETVLAWSILFAIVLSFLFAWGGIGNINLGFSRTPDMQEITNQVARDAVQQYNIASLSNDPIEICVQAMSVSAAYLQAQDQSNYLIWKEIEKDDCRRAGL